MLYEVITGSDDVSQNKGASVKESAPKVDPVSYVNIAQPFVFNVTGDKRSRVVQIQVQLMVRGSDNEDLARITSYNVCYTKLLRIGGLKAAADIMNYLDNNIEGALMDQLRDQDRNNFV